MLSKIQQRGFGILEYLALMIILMAGLLAFWPYIQQGMQGQYRKTGESFGFTRQYNPRVSVDCAYVMIEGVRVGYSQACFNHMIRKNVCESKRLECPVLYKLDCAAFPAIIRQGCVNINAQIDADIAACLKIENRSTYSACVAMTQKDCAVGCPQN